MKKRDEDLISDYLDGNETAFDTLMRRYQEDVFSLVRSVVLDQEDARDVTQKTFIKAFNNLERLRKRESFRAWLFRIAINMSRDHLRSRRQHLELKPWMKADMDNGPEKKLLAREIGQWVKRAIMNLPPRQQMVVSLRLIKGMSFKDISDHLHIREQTARTNFFFGIKGVRNFLSQKGLGI